jgi:hypothetical protein
MHQESTWISKSQKQWKLLIGIVYTNALTYIVLRYYVTLLMFPLKCRHCKEIILPTMMEVDGSTQGTINQQMFYNRKKLREIIHLRYSDVKTNVAYRLIEQYTVPFYCYISHVLLLD